MPFTTPKSESLSRNLLNLCEAVLSDFKDDLEDTKTSLDDAVLSRIGSDYSGVAYKLKLLDKKDKIVKYLSDKDGSPVDINVSGVRYDIYDVEGKKGIIVYDTYEDPKYLMVPVEDAEILEELHGL